MRFPMKTTSGDKLIRALYQHESFTMEEGIAIHLNFGTKASSTKAVYAHALKMQWIDQKGDRYFLPQHTKNYLDGCTVIVKPLGPIVTAPVRNVFGSTMQGYEAAMRSCMRRAEIEDAPSRML